MEWNERTKLIVGEDGIRKLSDAEAVVVGVGGVGAFAAEMLVRAGVGRITLVDSDTISVSNLNRQLPALHSTVGQSKCRTLRARLMDINPELVCTILEEYIYEENIPELFAGISPTVIVDAIDTLSPKIALIQYCLNHNIHLVSSMGSGAKMDATKIRVADISKTKMCPLAHMLRKRLHKLGITEGFTAVYSEETPMRESVTLEESRNKKSQVGSISYLPAVFGCVCAQAAIQWIVN